MYNLSKSSGVMKNATIFSQNWLQGEGGLEERKLYRLLRVEKIQDQFDQQWYDFHKYLFKIV